MRISGEDQYGSIVTLNEQHAPYPLAHAPMLIPALRVHSASAKHVPDSEFSFEQAVFWNLIMLTIPGNDGRLYCALVVATAANSVTINVKNLYIFDYFNLRYSS